LLLDVLREDADELERGLRVCDAAAGLLPLKPDPCDYLMWPQALRKDPLSKVVRPVANRRRRQSQHKREDIAFTDDIDAHHVLAGLTSTTAFVGSPLVQRAF